MLKNRIMKAIEEKTMKYGIIGTESVNVTLELTEEEKEEFNNIELDNHYSWEINGNELFISYVEEVK